MPIKHLYLFLFLAYGQLCPCAEQAPIRVLVWDVQPAQKQAYAGETIAAHLKTLPGLSVDSTSCPLTNRDSTRPCLTAPMCW